MSKSRLNRSLLLAGSFAFLASVVAIAQQPYFRLTPSSVTGTAGSPSELTPPPSTPAGPIAFGQGGTTDYRIATVVGEPFSLEMTTENGQAPITWLAAPADLPAGISYSDGVLFGFAEAPFTGERSFVAQDSTGAQATGRVTFQIVNAAVSLSRVKPLVRVGATFDGDIASNVRGAAYSIPGVPGLTTTVPDRNSKASLSGVATTPGTYSVVATVGRPGTSISASSQPSTVTVAPGLGVSFVPSYVTSLAGTAVDVEARPSGVVGTGALSLVSPDAATLSARGLAFANGRLTGTLAEGPSTELTVRLTDSADSAAWEASLTIPASTGAPAVIEIGEMRPGEAPEAPGGDSEPARIVTTIADPVCTVTQAVPGITVSHDCTISGVATTLGSYTLGVSIVPASNPSATPVVVTAPVTVHPTLMAASPAPNHAAAPGVPVSLVVNTSGIVGTASFSLVGTTPQALEAIGLTFDPATGAVTGTPDPGVNLAFEVEVTDSRDGATSRGPFTVVTSLATASMNTTPVQLRPGTVVTRVPTTNIANPRWSLIGAPSFVTINETTGEVTYTGTDLPEIVTMPAFVVRASSTARPQVFQDITVAVPGAARPALSLSIPDVSGTIGQAIAPVTVSLVGASQPQFNVSSNDLQGLSLTATSLGGTPIRAGTVVRYVTVTDAADGAQATHQVTISIASTLVATGPLASTYTGTTGQAIVAGAPSHTGAVGTVTWVIQSTTGGPAPAGTSVNASTGVVTALSASSGDLAVRLVAQDYIGVSSGAAQTSIVSPNLTFQFRSADASVARPNSASVNNGNVVGSGGNVAVLYDSPPYGSSRTGVSLYGSNSSITLNYTQPTEVDCVIVTATRSSYGGYTGTLYVNSSPNGVAGTEKSTIGGTIGLTPGPTRSVTIRFAGTNNHSAFVDTFRAGVMQQDGGCKTAP